MWSMIWPIGMVVAANCVYNICAKSAPADTNAFLGLFVTYVIAAGASLMLFFITDHATGGIFAELKKINWTYLVLGIVIVALEVGYIFVYRAGWQVNTAPLIANISLACVLLVVGFVLYKEALTLRQVLGVAVCIVGMILVGKK